MPKNYLISPFICILLCLLATGVRAEETTNLAGISMTAKTAGILLSDLQQLTELSPDEKSAVQLLTQGIADLDNAAEADKQLAKLNLLKGNPVDSEQQRQTIEKEKDDAKTRLGTRFDKLTQTDLEALKAKEDLLVKDLQQKLIGIDNQQEVLQDSPDQKSAEISDYRSQLGTIETQLVELKSSDVLTQLSKVRIFALSSRTLFYKSTLILLEAQFVNRDLSTRDLRAQRQLLVAAVDASVNNINVIGKKMTLLRGIEAEKVSVSAKDRLKELEGMHPALGYLAKLNSELASELLALTSHNDSVDHEVQQVDRLRIELDDEEQNVNQQLSISSRSAAVGEYLLVVRGDLPNTKSITKSVNKLREESAVVRLRRFHIESELTDIALSIPEYLRALASKNTSFIVKDKNDFTEQELGILRELAGLREQKLSALVNSYTYLIASLAKLQESKTELSIVAEQLRLSLDKTLLWIPTTAKVSLSWLGQMGQEFLWFGQSRRWGGHQNALRDWAGEHWLSLMFLAVLAAILVSLRRKTWLEIQSYNTYVGRPRADSVGYTLKALGLVFLWCLPISGSAVVLGWYASLADEQSVSYIGQALLYASIWAFFLGLVIKLVADDSVLQRHLNVSSLVRSSIGSRARILLRWGTPIVFLSLISEFYSRSLSFTGGMGRLLFFLAVILTTYVGWSLLKSGGGVFYGEKMAEKSLWGRRAVSMAWPVFLVLNIVLFFGAWQGYFYMVVTLEKMLIVSIAWLGGVWLARAICMRWLQIMERDIQVEQYLASLDVVENEGDINNPESYAQSQVAMLNVSIREQWTNMLRFGVLLALIFGFMAIWNEVLPALTLLNGIVLWDYSVTVDGLETIRHISLQEVLLAVFWFSLAMVFSTNLPPLLEVLLARGFAMDRGAIYAALTMARYAIISLGIVVAMSTLGVAWSDLQWLVAAIGIGLGFGLQEIVANFISGIIILFERPMRVGDVVTVGTTTGVVSKVEMRATTIVDWDNREMVVPN
ncbi:MAG: mechanosensitive ion channel domain-containing protein, partial [Pseudomonadales bacterium]